MFFDNTARVIRLFNMRAHVASRVAFNARPGSNRS